MFTTIDSHALETVTGSRGSWRRRQRAYVDALKSSGGLGKGTFDGNKLTFQNGNYVTYPQGIKNGAYAPAWELHNSSGGLLSSGRGISFPNDRPGY